MSKTPNYYIGRTHGIEARKVVEDFQSDNYNLGTALTYLMRAGKKPDNPITQDIRKAIAHLEFELERQNSIQQQNEQQHSQPTDNHIQERQADGQATLHNSWERTSTDSNGRKQYRVNKADTTGR